MIIELNEITKTYPGCESPAVENVSFTVEAGEVLTLLGPSGCGKTTLLRLIAGLERPDSGQIIIRDQEVASSKSWIAPEKREIGMVFQDYALFPHMNVYKNIAFGIRKYGKDMKRTRVLDMLKLIDMEDKINAYPHELSGGQQQRIALARALAPSPDILLLDEPFSNLDADLKLKIRHELRSIMKQADMTSIFVTHDYDDAKDIADRIVYLENGHIAHQEIVHKH